MRQANQLPEPPPEVRECFNKLTNRPADKALTKKEVVELIAKLRRSEVAKSQCGKRLLAMIDKHRKG